MNNKELYLNFIKRVLTDTVYDREITIDYLKTNQTPDEETLKEILKNPIRQHRLTGHDWPSDAHTMIGMKRMDNLHECLDYVRLNNVEGDIIETGVWRGGAMIFAKIYCDLYNINKKIFVCDSFDGLPVPEHPEDEGDVHYTFDFLKVPLDEVTSNFRLYNALDENVVFLKGWFSDTLPNNNNIGSLSILRMDGDMYKSTMDVFDSLYHKVNQNGFIIVDDYCIPNCRKATEDFRKQNNITSELNVIDNCGVFWKK